MNIYHVFDEILQFLVARSPHAAIDEEFFLILCLFLNLCVNAL